MDELVQRGPGRGDYIQDTSAILRFPLWAKQGLPGWAGSVRPRYMRIRDTGPTSVMGKARITWMGWFGKAQVEEDESCPSCH